MPKIQNTDGRLILTAEVTKNKIAKTSIIYLNKFAVRFSLDMCTTRRFGTRDKKSLV